MPGISPRDQWQPAVACRCIVGFFRSRRRCFLDDASQMQEASSGETPAAPCHLSNAGLSRSGGRFFRGSARQRFLPCLCFLSSSFFFGRLFCFHSIAELTRFTIQATPRIGNADDPETRHRARGWRLLLPSHSAGFEALRPIGNRRWLNSVLDHRPMIHGKGHLQCCIFVSRVPTTASIQIGGL